jgi:hypothetical protein
VIRAGVERVFHKFFQRTSRPLDDFAGRDAIDEFWRQPFY